MKRFTQTLRIGLALFIAMFGTSALPSAAAYAVEDAIQETTQTEAVPPPATDQIEPTVQEPVVVETPEVSPPPEVPPAQEVIVDQQVMTESAPVDQIVDDVPFEAPESFRAMSLSQSEVKEDKPGQEVCPNDTFTELTGGWDKTDGLSSTSFPVPQKDGFTVVELCYKASNDVVYPDVTTTVTSTATNDKGEIQNLSHVSVRYEKTVTPAQIVVNPVAPEKDDVCETEDDTFVKPANTAQITYTVLGNIVTATLVNPLTHDFGAPLNGYVVAGDGLTATHTVTFTNTPCDEEEETCPANTEWFDANDNQKVDEGECYKKVWVCKYVGTPGVDEQLKQGNDGLVQVSVHAIQQNQWNGTIPGWFSDAQDRSYVIDFVDDKKDPPSADDCPQPVDEPEEPTVAVLDTACIAEGQTGTFTIRVTNNNDFASEYRVNVEGGDTEAKSVPANLYGDFTFTGYVAGTYDYNVQQKIANEVDYEYERNSILEDAIALPAYTWVTVAEGSVTLENCPRVIGDTDVCPNITGSQATVPAGYTLTNGQCVMPQVLAAAVAVPAQLPAELPATGQAENNFALLLGIVLSALTYFVMLRRYQEA